MLITCSQMHHTDKYSQHSSNIWPAWLNGWVFVYDKGDCRLWLWVMVIYEKLVEKCCHFYMVLLNIKKGEDEVLVASKHIWFLQYAKVWSFLMCCLENMAHLRSSNQVWLYCQNTWAFVTLLCRVYINTLQSCFGWEKT